MAVAVPVPVPVPVPDLGADRAHATATTLETTPGMPELSHEKLDVYRAALAFLAAVDEILEHVAKGKAHLSDQLDRAATSIVLNVAEGAGEFSAAEKARFYRIARRSANECAAILDVYQARKAVEERLVIAGRDLLVRVVAMLTRMVLAR